MGCGMAYSKVAKVYEFLSSPVMKRLGYPILLAICLSLLPSGLLKAISNRAYGKRRHGYCVIPTEERV